MINCINLTKQYNDRCVIERYSGIFSETGFYLLLGESGSGKTTFLNLLAGFLPFEGGSIQWDHTTFTDRVEHLGDPPFDYLTQDSFFVDFLTVEENLMLLETAVPEKQHQPTLSEDAAVGLKQFGLWDKKNAYPSNLSGGEQGRLAILRALLRGKKVLFLDEPTAALDFENRKMIFETLSSLKNSVLIICATHDKTAIPYADSILYFSKKDRTPKMENKTSSCGDSQTPSELKDAGISYSQNVENVKYNLRYFLKKWLDSSKREQRAKRAYLFFLTVSALLMLLADTPSHKLAATCEKLYHINTLQLSLTNGKQLDELKFDRSEVDEIVVDYRGSCPTGHEIREETNTVPSQGYSPRYDSFIWTLPEKEEHFALKDAIASGTYYTAPQQVILSYEMAEAMMPGQSEKLIGRTLTRNFFKLGMVELTIVGVLKQPSFAEQVYLNSCGAEYDLENYMAEKTQNLFFINAALTKPFVDDPDLYHDEGQRAYIFYFDTYSARNRFLSKYQQSFRQQRAYLDTYAVHTIEEWELPYLFWILLPLSLLIAIFTAVFYAELGRTEFIYNNTFASVFEYAGYEKKQILRELVIIQTLDFLKLFIVGLGAAGFLSFVGNGLNRRFMFADYELFTYNPWLLCLYSLFMVGLTISSLSLRFRKIALRSWYENLMANRDVL